MSTTRVKVRCNECGKAFQTASLSPLCPKCGGADVDAREHTPAPEPAVVPGTKHWTDETPCPSDDVQAERVVRDHAYGKSAARYNALAQFGARVVEILRDRADGYSPQWHAGTKTLIETAACSLGLLGEPQPDSELVEAIRKALALHRERLAAGLPTDCNAILGDLFNSHGSEAYGRAYNVAIGLLGEQKEESR